VHAEAARWKESSCRFWLALRKGGQGFLRGDGDAVDKVRKEICRRLGGELSREIRLAERFHRGKGEG